jgi:hypothetical protein
MFEVALELWIRRGELLKLRLDSLPRGADDGIRILRRPDPHDSRSKEPAVKTAERVIPASRNLLAAIRAYLTYPRPLGRISGRSPYLFVTRSGSPVSMDTADDVIAAIGGHSGVSPLSWHRLRPSGWQKHSRINPSAWTGSFTLADGPTRSPPRVTSSAPWQARRRKRFEAIIGSCTRRRRMLDAARVSRLSDLPPLPTTVHSFDGQLVDTRQEVWRFRSSTDGGKAITLHWIRQDEPSILSPRARHLLKLYFADRIARKNARTIENDFRYVPAPAGAAALAHSSTGRVGEPD